MAKKRVALRVRCRTGKNEIRMVVNRVTAGGVRRILNSAEICIEKKAVFVATHARENAATVTRKYLLPCTLLKCIYDLFLLVNYSN